MNLEQPLILKIAEVVEEAKGIKSIFFNHKLEGKPGQFLMVWVPGLDMKPFGISYINSNSFGITVCSIGETSAAICKAKKGELLGIIGPYGNSFSLEGKRIMLIAGGYGAATLFPLAREAKKKNIMTTFVIGAKTGKFLLYRDRVKKADINSIFTTEDGSYGRKGLTTGVLEEALKAEGVDKVYACGPELMLRKVAELCRHYKVKCEISMERYMKCGFGICGSCCVDEEGFPVCKEGTVISGEKALQIKEFCQYHRDASGARHYF